MTSFPSTATGAQAELREQGRMLKEAKRRMREAEAKVRELAGSDSREQEGSHKARGQGGSRVEDLVLLALGQAQELPLPPYAPTPPPLLPPAPGAALPSSHPPFFSPGLALGRVCNPANLGSFCC